MDKQSVQFIPPQQSRQLTDFAERARISLARFARAEVDFNAIGLQMLDEWIDRHLKQFPHPSPEIAMIWGAFLGETFRRRFNGQWAISKSGNKAYLGVLCPKPDSGLIYVDVMRQMDKRLKIGISQSLAYYYTMKGVDINSSG
jgi:hypothetical protein